MEKSITVPRGLVSVNEPVNRYKREIAEHRNEKRQKREKEEDREKEREREGYVRKEKNEKRGETIRRSSDGRAGWG